EKLQTADVTPLELEASLLRANVAAAFLPLSAGKAIAAATATTRVAIEGWAGTAEPSTARTVFGRVYAQRPAAQFIAVEFLDGARRRLVRGEFHAGQAAWAATLTVGGQEHVTNLASLREQRLNFVTRGVEVQVSYKHFRRHRSITFLRLQAVRTPSQASRRSGACLAIIRQPPVGRDAAWEM